MKSNYKLSKKDQVILDQIVYNRLMKSPFFAFTQCMNSCNKEKTSDSKKEEKDE